MRFLVDEDLPPACAELLRQFGHEAEHVTEVGLRGCADRLVFEGATARRAILLSADVAFADIRAFPPGTHHGVFLLRFPDHFRRSDILALLRSFLGNVDIDRLVGTVTVIEPASYRVRRSATEDG